MDTKYLPILTASGRSKYKALADEIRNAISKGELAPGQQLPAVRNLAHRLAITPGTVARAYSLLIKEGVLQADVGRGTFVTELAPGSGSSKWPEFIDLSAHRLPSVGQETLLRDGLKLMAADLERDALMFYPEMELGDMAEETLHRWLAGIPIGPFERGDVIVSYGSRQALMHTFMTVFRDETPALIVDNLCHGGVWKTAELCRARLLSVSWDNEGPRVDELERLIRESGAKAYCTSAEVNNPTTRATSAARRREVVTLARRYGLHIIDDDCYPTSDRVGESYRALAPELSWYVASLSNLISPALRIGVVVPPQGWRRAIEQSAYLTRIGVSQVLLELAVRALNNPLLGMTVSRMRERMNADLKVMVNLLGSHQLSWREDVPFAWLELPDRWRVGAFMQAAEASGVKVTAADAFQLRDARAVHAVRISVNSQVHQGCFEEGVTRLRRLLEQGPEHVST